MSEMKLAKFDIILISVASGTFGVPHDASGLGGGKPKRASE